ncbi:Protein CBG22707 [Caenorhabditis briggsae]|uniref:RBR-type E3 ubiquitin transferase n=1 Tax=Caenorhabditis briggsae TaxID=6238 RepID=A8Y2Z8_CAEBR|nr:Protein CBG22707 [Caenorhabditis briggsae]CAP39238.2 Protein CBG22707 [Caenorhabditis briggsae]
MTSVSSSDVRSNVSGSISSKRYRGSDTGSGMDSEGGETCAEMLLSSRNQDDEEQTDEKKLSQSLPETPKTPADAGAKKGKGKMKECPLCAAKLPCSSFPKLRGCQHRSCRTCLRHVRNYYHELNKSSNKNQISFSISSCQSRRIGSKFHVQSVPHFFIQMISKCFQDGSGRHPNIDGEVRSVQSSTIPNDGGRCTLVFVFIATKCAACPQLKCQRPECGTLFCYHCKREWHSNQTCDEARRPEKRKSRGLAFEEIMRNGFHPSADSTLKPGDVKACPRCKTYIVKMDDGSCNHMVCTMCNAEFCWLCLKEISDLHYLSPTGCTFWGKKPWTRKKKLLWQIGTLIGAPLGIALIAGLSIPGIVFGVPVFVGRKVHQRFKYKSKAKRRLLTATCVVGSLVVSPVMAVMAVGVGVPIMLAYVYGVVPLSLCRNGGCGLSSSDSSLALANIDEEQLYGTPGANAPVDVSQFLSDSSKREEIVSIDPSILSAISMPHEIRPRHYVNLDLRGRRTSFESVERVNYEEASVKAMAGSHHYDDKSVHTVYSGHEVTSLNDEQSSTKALAGSVMDTKSMSESMYRHLIVTKIAEKQHQQDTDDYHEEPGCSSEDQPSTSSVVHPVRSSKPSTSSQHRGFLLERDEEGLLFTEEGAALLINSSPAMRSSGSVNVDPIDLFKIRSWLDNMKQMVATDAPQEKPYEENLTAEIQTTENERDEEGLLFTEEGAALLINSSPAMRSSGSVNVDPIDLFKIRSWLDNMKQMVATDAPQEKPYEPSTRPGSKLRRSGSGKSVHTVATFPATLGTGMSPAAQMLSDLPMPTYEDIHGVPSSTSGVTVTASRNNTETGITTENTTDDNVSTSSSSGSQKKKKRRFGIFSNWFSKK